MQKSTVLKKLCLVLFFKSDYKMVSYEKSENIMSSIFQKRTLWYFPFFLRPNFIQFLKNTQDIVFSTMYILAY